MKKIWLIVIAGSLAVLSFDVLGSLASRQFGFAYESLISGSMVLYAAVGFAARRTTSIPMAILATVMVGMVDATAGWALSWWIGPGRPTDGTFTMVNATAGAAFVAVLSATCGAAGALLRTIIKGPSRADA